MDPFKPEDKLSADVRAFLKWGLAYGAWLDGNRQPMADWIADPHTVITDDARHFLADYLLGKARRPRGRKSSRSGQLERKITHDVFCERAGLAARNSIQRPYEKALEKIAKRHRLPTGAVRGIIDRLGKAGLTFEWWIRAGRPPLS